MSPSSIRVAALAFFAALTLCACARTSEADQGEHTLRVYQVPPARTEALGMALNDVFWTGEAQAPVGKASSRVPGQLLVLAPAALHASIDDTLGQLVSGTEDSAPAGSNVQLHFWLIDAVPGNPEATASAAPSAVVDALERQFPRHSFQLRDQARLGIQGLSGHGFLTTGAGTDISARVGAEGNGILADVEIVTGTESGRSRLQTSVALSMDEYVVLAVTGAPGGGEPAPQRIVVMQATSG